MQLPDCHGVARYLDVRARRPCRVRGSVHCVGQISSPLGSLMKSSVLAFGVATSFQMLDIPDNHFDYYT
jgi:hypothetical protein